MHSAIDVGHDDDDYDDVANKSGRNSMADEFAADFVGVVVESYDSDVVLPPPLQLSVEFVAPCFV